MTPKQKYDFSFYVLSFLFLIYFLLDVAEKNDLNEEIDALRIENAQLSILNNEIGKMNAKLLLENAELAQNNSLLEKKLMLLFLEAQEAQNNQRVVVLPKRINIELGSYNLRFDSKCWLGEQYVGCTAYGRDITLVDNRTVSEIIETCNHEYIHNQIKVLDSQFEEQVVRQLDDKVIVPECEALREVMR